MPVLALLLSGLVFVPGTGCAVTSADEVALREPYIRVRDVVMMNCLAPDAVEEVGGIAIAKLSDHQQGATFTRLDVQTLVRRRIPALGNRLTGTGEGVVKLSFQRQGDNSVNKLEAGCFELRVPLKAGEIVTESDVQAAPCEASRTPSEARFDRRAGVLRAKVDLNAGGYMGKIYFGTEAVAQGGEDILLCSASGPVSVTRRVEALQPVAAGHSAFVRGSDGKAFATASFCSEKKG